VNPMSNRCIEIVMHPLAAFLRWHDRAPRNLLTVIDNILATEVRLGTGFIEFAKLTLESTAQPAGASLRS
jgi:hypothetical protein